MSTKTSAAAIKNAIDIRMPGFAFCAGLGSASNVEEWVCCRVPGVSGIQWFQAGSGLSSVGKNEALAFTYTPQESFCISAEFKHRYGPHDVKFKLKLN